MNTASLTNAQTGSPKTSPLNVYAVFVACATFLLVIAGGLVKSTGSSLAVPDWPLSFGQYFPKMEGGVLYEHGHRMIAGTVGILTLILAGWVWKAGASRAVWRLALAAVAAVGMQACLGGITVLYRLPVLVSMAHACLGQIFFCLVVAIATLTGSATNFPATENMAKLKRLGWMTLGFIFLQLLAGAYMRNTGKGLHMHLTGAVLVAIHVQLLARRVLKALKFDSKLCWLAAGMPLLIVIQIILGYISWRTGPVLTTTAHVAMGAFIFASATIITAQASRQRS